MMKRKGVSGVILTIIMIVLVLAAVAVIWGIINNILQTQTEQVDVSSKCLNVNIQSTKLDCSNGVCNVTVTRDSSGEAIAGMKLVFITSAGDANYIHDVPGNVELLETKTISDITTTGINATDVSITPYFLDTSGNEQLCAT